MLSPGWKLCIKDGARDRGTTLGLRPNRTDSGGKEGEEARGRRGAWERPVRDLGRLINTTSLFWISIVPALLTNLIFIIFML